MGLLSLFTSSCEVLAVGLSLETLLNYKCILGGRWAYLGLLVAGFFSIFDH